MEPSCLVILAEDSATGTTIGFFDLPRETRDMIYDLIWDNVNSVQVLFRGHICQVTYKSGGPPGRFPPALYANKQLLEESFEQLQCEGYWDFHRAADQVFGDEFVQRWLNPW